MFKKNKKKKYKNKKIFKIIISLGLLILVFIFIWFHLDLWRFTFLKKKIAAREIEYVLDNSFLDRGKNFRSLDYYLKIFLSSKDDDFINEKIIYLLKKNNVDSSLKIYIIKYLSNNNYLEDNIKLKNSLEELSKSNLSDYYLKIFLLKNFTDLNNDKNMVEYLKSVSLNKDLSITQRKVALRSLWTVFNSVDLVSFYKQILSFNKEKELQKEALKALSSLDKKENILKIEDLNMYNGFLNNNDHELEKITLFLLANYYYLYPKETKNWFINKDVSPANKFLANELFK
jgi:hypothetical protein